MSVHEKIFHWQETLDWLKSHFSNTDLKNHVPLATWILVVFELIAAVLCCIGIVEFFINKERLFGYYGTLFSCISLLLMLFGQRLAKDFDGARTITIYFIVAVLGVWLLGS
ncbi:DoxX family protein [Flavobacterium aciduliphilum]|nr:DoxX family protein [Flavobacterium aciduliphilum]